MKKDPTELPSDVQAQIRGLKALLDDQIDTTDVPELLDWSNARRGVCYRLVKQQITLRSMPTSSLGSRLARGTVADTRRTSMVHSASTLRRQFILQAKSDGWKLIVGRQWGPLTVHSGLDGHRPTRSGEHRHEVVSRPLASMVFLVNQRVQRRADRSPDRRRGPDLAGRAAGRQHGGAAVSLVPAGSGGAGRYRPGHHLGRAGPHPPTGPGRSPPRRPRPHHAACVWHGSAGRPGPRGLVAAARCRHTRSTGLPARPGPACHGIQGPAADPLRSERILWPVCLLAFRHCWRQARAKSTFRVPDPPQAALPRTGEVVPVGLGVS